MNDSDTGRTINITVVLGTARPESYTGKAVALVVDELRKQPVGLNLVDLTKVPLSPPGVGGSTKQVAAITEQMRASTGIILATPEYHGSFSGALKLLIENLGFPSVMAGKPVALLGVAAGQIGAIKSLEHLRSVCSHIGAIVLPGPVSVANVRDVFDSEGRISDPKIEQRIRGVAHSLLDYLNRHVCPATTLEAMVRE